MFWKALVHPDGSIKSLEAVEARDASGAHIAYVEAENKADAARAVALWSSSRMCCVCFARLAVRWNGPMRNLQGVCGPSCDAEWRRLDQAEEDARQAKRDASADAYLERAERIDARKAKGKGEGMRPSPVPPSARAYEIDVRVVQREFRARSTQSFARWLDAEVAACAYRGVA